ncbi:cold-shock protein [Streptomyces lunaelactis]|uniref:Cold-shock protein n=1 Tax=Streptomyces lunaelactis TaxID=1535768 RepID=A0A2R4TC99_9ACTN|nr:cold shock domain-containing protein [Streptomyces lunaelactis]AVZ76743.1 cold-shock protein [Streptomyces lunaelactis]NUK83610.1 cold shock domain-containing protein [Streptomyces lunaelactis]
MAEDRFNDDTGFGFIPQVDGCRDMFVLFSSIQTTGFHHREESPGAKGAAGRHLQALTPCAVGPVAAVAQSCVDG